MEDHELAVAVRNLARDAAAPAIPQIVPGPASEPPGDALGVREERGRPRDREVLGVGVVRVERLLVVDEGGIVLAAELVEEGPQVSGEGVFLIGVVVGRIDLELPQVVPDLTDLDQRRVDLAELLVVERREEVDQRALGRSRSS